MPGDVRIGTSGYVYKHWREVFYPRGLKSAEWLPYYANFFDTVEINNSFYHLVKATDTRRWRAAVPDDFRFVMKGSRYITHMLKLKDVGPAFERFLTPVRGLGPKLGPVLFQLPPHWGVNIERLELFLQLFRRRRLQVVMEFREPGWYCPEVYRVLERYRASLCLHDMQGSENHDRIVGPLVYVRRHGTGIRYSGDYPDHELQGLADRIHGWRAENRDVYVYFNNDGHGYAVKNALTLKGMVETRV